MKDAGSRQRARHGDTRRRIRIHGAAAAARPSPGRTAARRGAGHRRLRDRLSRIRPHVAARGRDQGIHAVDAGHARRRLYGVAALRAVRAGLRRRARRVLNEARLLAQFDHPGTVKVLHFWESHGTAYMVMPFYEGRTLKQLLDGGMRISETQLRNIVGAARRARHAASRAVLPSRRRARQRADPPERQRDPARLRRGPQTDRRPVDDGAMMIKPGYAPIEQYTDDPAFSQGPWTDLYALGAVMHAMITGELPPAAVVRSIRTRTGRSRRANCRPARCTARRFSRRSIMRCSCGSRIGRNRSRRSRRAGLRDVGTGGGYGAAVVPPVGDAGRSGEGKGRLLLRPLRRRLLARLRSARAGPLRATLRRMGER